MKLKNNAFKLHFQWWLLIFCFGREWPSVIMHKGFLVVHNLRSTSVLSTLRNEDISVVDMYIQGNRAQIIAPKLPPEGLPSRKVGKRSFQFPFLGEFFLFSLLNLTLKNISMAPWFLPCVSTRSNRVAVALNLPICCYDLVFHISILPLPMLPENHFHLNANFASKYIHSWIDASSSQELFLTRGCVK